MAANGRHLAKTAEYGSQPGMVADGRAVMGGIDLDPASSAKWNQIVGARRIITKREDGRYAPWRLAGEPPLRVWLNSPGDASGDLVPSFWARLVAEWKMGNVLCAVWVGFSMSHFRTLQMPSAIAHPLELPLCVPEQRLPYMELVRGVARLTRSPSHDSYVTLLPPHGDGRIAMLERWRRIFGKHGRLFNS